MLQTCSFQNAFLTEVTESTIASEEPETTTGEATKDTEVTELDETTESDVTEAPEADESTVATTVSDETTGRVKPCYSKPLSRIIIE